MKKLFIGMLVFWVTGTGLSLAQTKDSELLGDISIIDQNEIKAAQVAEKKKVDKNVIDYAKMLEKEHAQNLDEVTRLSSKLNIPIDDSASSINDLRSKGVNGLNSITALDGDDFSKGYITAMITGHTDALNLIDSQMNDVENNEVKVFLSKTREHVDMHLQKAQKIQTMAPQ